MKSPSIRNYLKNSKKPIVAFFCTLLNMVILFNHFLQSSDVFT